MTFKIPIIYVIMLAEFKCYNPPFRLLCPVYPLLKDHCFIWDRKKNSSTYLCVFVRWKESRKVVSCSFVCFDSNSKWCSDSLPLLKWYIHGNYIGMAPLSPVWYVSMCVSQFVSSLSVYENYYTSASFVQPINRQSLCVH